MKRTDFVPRLSVFLLTTLFTLGLAFAQEYQTILQFLQSDRAQQFTTLIQQLSTSDF